MTIFDTIKYPINVETLREDFIRLPDGIKTAYWKDTERIKMAQSELLNTYMMVSILRKIIRDWEE